MSIESVGAVSGSDSSQMASKMAKKMMTDFDVNGGGSIDKKEFASALKKKTAFRRRMRTRYSIRSIQKAQGR